jgi:anti-anti-sigma factor
MVEFEILQRSQSHVLLGVRGELAGAFRTEALGETLEELFVDDGVKVIRVDLSPVSFLDNFGVATLMDLHRRSRERGKRFVIENARGQVEEKLKVTGVLGVLQPEE